MLTNLRRVVSFYPHLVCLFSLDLFSNRCMQWRCTTCLQCSFLIPWCAATEWQINVCVSFYVCFLVFSAVVDELPLSKSLQTVPSLSSFPVCTSHITVDLCALSSEHRFAHSAYFVPLALIRSQCKHATEYTFADQQVTMTTLPLSSDRFLLRARLSPVDDAIDKQTRRVRREWEWVGTAIQLPLGRLKS